MFNGSGFYFDNLDDDGPSALGACESPEEAFVKIKDEVVGLVPGLEKRDAWWRFRWRKLYDTKNPLVREVAEDCGTTKHRLIHYLMVISGFSNKTGKDAVYAKRERIAEDMDCSVMTVARCRKAAIKLGFHTPGFQLRWLNKDTDTWCGGPSMVLLKMPDFASIKEDIVKAKRILSRKAAKAKAVIERKQKQRREQRERLEKAIRPARTVEQSKIPGKRTKSVQEAIREARKHLLDTS